MAAEKEAKSQIKSGETVRERAAKSQQESAKPRRLRRQPKVIPTDKKQRKEFHLPLPDNKIGRFLSKKVHFVPSYFKEAWSELKQVSWPNRGETLKLSLAVFMFSAVFGGLIWLLDYGLDNLFRKVLIG